MVKGRCEGKERKTVGSRQGGGVERKEWRREGGKEGEERSKVRGGKTRETSSDGHKDSQKRRM